MSSADTCSERTGGASSLIETIVERIAAVIADRRAARRRRHAVSSLRSLDARMLADIGMSRSEITSIVYCSTADRRRRHESD